MSPRLKPYRSFSRRRSYRAWRTARPRRRGNVTGLSLAGLAALAGWVVWVTWPDLEPALRARLWWVGPVAWWLGLGSGVAVALVVGAWWGQVRRVRTRRTAQAEASRRVRALHVEDPLAFERQVGRLFEAEGYRVASTPRSGDEGIDLWLEKMPQQGWWAHFPGSKPLLRGAGARRIPVQCKRYAPDHAVGSPELQRFSGAMRGAHAAEGYFVTTSRFTPAAQAWAKREGIHLIDGEALGRWHRRLLPATRAAWDEGRDQRGVMPEHAPRDGRTSAGKVSAGKGQGPAEEWGSATGVRFEENDPQSGQGRKA